MKMHDSDYLDTMYHLVADLYSVKPGLTLNMW